MDKFVTDIFKGEVIKQCDFALYSVENINLFFNNSERKTIVFWYHIQSFLDATANISKLFWGVNGTPPHKRKELRDLFEIKEDSILKSTKFRNNFAHYDERLERWAKKSINNFYIDSNIGPINMISNLNTNSYMRHYDPETKILSFEGQEYNIQLVVDELIYIQEKGKSIPL